MRKFILLLTMAVLFMACGNEEEASNQDVLLGKWKLIEIREGSLVNKIECQDAIQINFKVDGVFDVEHYSFNETEDCILMGKIDEGTWKNTNNKTYDIDGSLITPIFENNIMILVSNYDDGSTSSGVYERQ